jgi:signal transduction histidine kinase
VTVELALHGREVTLAVRDNGKGFTLLPGSDETSTTFGLATMRERAGISGARLHIRTAPGHGTEVRVTVPAAGRGGGVSGGI